MEIKVLSKEDGYWLSLRGKRSALIHLGEIRGPIVEAALEEAASEKSPEWHSGINGSWRYVDPDIQAQMPSVEARSSLFSWITGRKWRKR